MTDKTRELDPEDHAQVCEGDCLVGCECGLALTSISEWDTHIRGIALVEAVAGPSEVKFLAGPGTFVRCEDCGIPDPPKDHSCPVPPTSGPWSADVETLAPWKTGVFAMRDGEPVRAICSTTHPSASGSYAVDEANARLIASAPDLVAERDRLLLLRDRAADALVKLEKSLGLIERLFAGPELTSHREAMSHVGHTVSIIRRSYLRVERAKEEEVSSGD